ncbi:unnamed protein product [Pleuronectes platessa]|uniref:Uncharacterized protein n=1 Tax=Pleuronectes platessa TaxID=8262 RepID=A0A9N7U9M0_PLEPL|nr:unnamed protein product [Pleuronectes platessa]
MRFTTDGAAPGLSWSCSLFLMEADHPVVVVTVKQTTCVVCLCLAATRTNTAGTGAAGEDVSGFPVFLYSLMRPSDLLSFLLVIFASLPLCSVCFLPPPPPPLPPPHQKERGHHL